MRVKEIEIESIYQGDQLIRDNPEDDSIGELAQDMAQKGLLQPVGVASRPEGGYQLLWGDRRCRAAIRINWAKISAHVWEGPVSSIKAIALVENLQRRQLTLTEEVEAVRYMIEEDKLSVNQVSAALSKGRSWVENRMMVPTLPDFLREPLLCGDLPMTHCEEIAKVEHPGAQAYLTSLCIQNRWTRSQLRQVCEAYIVAPSIAEVKVGGVPGVAPGMQKAAYLYECQSCGVKLTIDKTTLLRVCKDGCRSKPASGGSGDKDSGIDGVEGD